MRVPLRISSGDFFAMEGDDDTWQVFRCGTKKPLRRYTTRRAAVGTAQTLAWRSALSREVRIAEGSSV
jgi:hypothetical protein